MTRLLEARWCWLALLALGACGGEVDLGNRADTGPAADPANEPPPDDPYWVKTERVIDLRSIEVFGPLAAVGDFLYVTGYTSSFTPSLFRCKKTNCSSSWERLPTVNEFLYSLQVVEQRLAVTGGDPLAFLGSYALPDVTDRRVVLEGLSKRFFDVRQTRFYRNFVYWPLHQDSAYYRCELPSCGPGPRKIVDSWSTLPASFDADSIFVTSNGLILRIAELGDGPVERLLPDATLSTAPDSSESEPEPPSEAAKELATSNGWLYATLGSLGCDQGCQTRIVRWPATGGPREELFASNAGITNLFVFDNELMWFDGASDLATLASCRVEACSSTLRHLGLVDTGWLGVTSDDERLYWLEASHDQDAPYAAAAIRSVARLPVP